MTRDEIFELIIRNKSIQERFWANIDRKGENECWLYTGVLTWKGYGKFHVIKNIGRGHI